MGDFIDGQVVQSLGGRSFWVKQTFVTHKLYRARIKPHKERFFTESREDLTDLEEAVVVSMDAIAQGSVPTIYSPPLHPGRGL
jgi:hypothetical protein